MAVLGLQAALLFLLGIALHAARGDFCLDSGGTDPGAATICHVDFLDNCLGRELTGDIYVIGNGTSTWDVGVSPLSFAPDARLSVSCLHISLEQPSLNEMQPHPNNYSALLHPPFLLSHAKTPLSSLTLRDVEISLSCKLLLMWQEYLCGVQLPGKTLIQDNTVSIVSWMVEGVSLERVLLTCDPGDTTFSPICSMAVVNEVSDILEASSRLQTPYLPLVLVVYQGLSFTDSSWPEEGLRITANVTLSATLGSYVTISFGLKTVLFTVDKNFSSTAFLSFRGCILVDLPLSYLPVHHPRRPFGVLSTALWPVYREEVAMGLYSCTLILTHEEFKFWSFWLSILVSPIPSVRAMGNWTYASKVTLGTSGDDFIQLENYFGRYTTLHDVRYQVSNELYATQQRNNILQITNDEAVPPTVVFQTRNSSDLLSALSSSPSATAAQHGQYIILTANLTIMNESQWPPDGAPIRYPTTITTWPSSWVAFDLRQMRNAFKILGSTSTTIKNVVLLNLAPGPSDSELAGLTTGLWAFNFSWGNADYQRLNLDNVVMVVPREEVNYYITTAVDQKQTDTWISSFEVLSQDTVNRSWVQFRSLATTRFIARYLNITDTIPYVFDSDSLNITTVSGHVWNFRDGGSASEDGRNVLLFALVAIALPTALGSALLTYILLRRRRLTRLCQSEGPPQGSKLKDGGGDGEDCAGVEEHEEHKAARQDELPACCFPFPLSLPLRKSKFVNPLYHDGGRAPPDIILTGVLGPAALARSLAPVPPETTILDSSTSISTVAELALELEGVPAAQGETLAEQTVTGDAFTGRRSGNSPGDNPPLCVLSAAPAELRQGREASESLADAAADSGISSLSETCTAGFGPRLEHGGPSRSSATRLTPGGVNTVMQSAAAGCATGGTALLVHGAGTRPPPPEISCERRDSPAVAAATAELAIMPSTSRGQNADAGISEIVRAGAHCLAPNAHPGGCGEAGLQVGPRHPRFMDLQQLDRLRREIGDRHLEVQHSLGWGGCGVVYKGVWKGLQVAVKTILLQGDSKQSHQFLTEAEISASLQHANIVTTYLYELRPLGEVDSSAGAVEIRTRSASSDEAPGQDTERMSCWKLYIVQEYCELGTLKAAIDQGYFKGSGNGLPNLAFLLTMALDISLGLAHVHSKNVVHGDVTVSNVLLQAFPGRPQGCIAKVADFGLSVKFEAGQSQGYHLYGGTPHYMAPERVRGFLYKQSDIYSLGVCLWELYCGTPPWRRNAAGAHHRGYGGVTSSSSVDSEGHHRHHHHRHHSFGDSAALQGAESESFRFPRGCPSEYSALVHSCLSGDPQARPTAAAVASALQRLHRRYC